MVKKHIEEIKILSESNDRYMTDNEEKQWLILILTKELELKKHEHI